MQARPEGAILHREGFSDDHVAEEEGLESRWGRGNHFACSHCGGTKGRHEREEEQGQDAHSAMLQLRTVRT